MDVGLLWITTFFLGAVATVMMVFGPLAAFLTLLIAAQSSFVARISWRYPACLPASVGSGRTWRFGSSPPVACRTTGPSGLRSA